MATVWIVIIEDRHADAEVLPYTNMPAAISTAWEWAGTDSGTTEEEITDAMARDGWILCLSVGLESDSVRVVERELDGPLNR